MTKITTKNPSLKQIIALGAIVAASIFGGFAVNVWLKVGVTPDKEVVTETKVEISNPSNIELPEVEVLETDTGEIVVKGAQTVESVDSQNSSILDECDNEEECGLGAYYYAPVDTPYDV